MTGIERSTAGPLSLVAMDEDGMCGRYNLLPNARAWLDAMGLLTEWLADYVPRYNIAPGQDAPVIRQGMKGPELVLMRWGFVPEWMKDPKPKAQPINARADTVTERPYFRSAIKHRRCLIPATGFYEWQGTGRGKQPWHIHLADGHPFLMAGIWSTWAAAPEGPVNTFAILTTGPNRELEPIHDRMPAIIQEAHMSEWLTTENLGLLTPYPAGALETDAIGQWVNNPLHEGPSVLARDPGSPSK